MPLTQIIIALQGLTVPLDTIFGFGDDFDEGQEEGKDEAMVVESPKASPEPSIVVKKGKSREVNEETESEPLIINDPVVSDSYALFMLSPTFLSASTAPTLIMYAFARRLRGKGSAVNAARI